jgi:arylsulfatase A-like enzyme
MISSLDAAVGRILDALRRLDLERDTLVIFLSDNGASISSNAPLRGTKATLFEGGIRVPFLVRWPAALPGGVYDHPVSSLDVLPTAAAAAGVAPPADRPLDGVDLLPYLSGARDAPPHEALYWRFQNAWAIRSGSMKLVHSRDHWNDETLHTGLFDLAVDVAERDDLSQAQPRLRRQLHQRLREWERSVVPVSVEAPR